MRHLISWETLLALFTAWVLVYYGVTFIFGRKLANRKRQDGIPRIAALTITSTKVRNEEPATHVIDSPIPPIFSFISPSFPEMLTSFLAYRFERASNEYCFERRLLQIMTQPLAASLTKDMQVLGDSIRITFGDGSACRSLRLSVPEIGTALGLHESSP